MTAIKGRPRTIPTVMSNGFTLTQWAWLREEAIAHCIPIAQIIREAVDIYIDARESERAEPNEKAHSY